MKRSPCTTCKKDVDRRECSTDCPELKEYQRMLDLQDWWKKELLAALSVDPKSLQRKK